LCRTIVCDQEAAGVVKKYSGHYFGIGRRFGFCSAILVKHEIYIWNAEQHELMLSVVYKVGRNMGRN